RIQHQIFQIDTLNIMTDFSFRAGADSSPFVINRLKLSAGYDIQGVYLKNLVLDSPMIQARGGLSLKKSDTSAVKGSLDWQVKPPGYPKVTGHTRVSGQLS